MPTYRNDKTSGDILIEGLSGETIRLKPGETGQTYKFYDRTGLTKTVDAPIKTLSTPYTVTNAAGGAATVSQEIGAGIKRARVQVNTAGVTAKVYLQTTTDNDPMPPDGGLTSAHGIWSFDIDGHADTLQFAFSGDGNLTLETFTE
jgi:hypothetical protein